MTKYSEWFRIDLHIHTDLSNSTKPNDYKGNFDVGTLHKKLTENQVRIFSLTDHNIINTDAYKKYYETYARDDDPILFLGVELDIEKDKIYHSLLIFNCHSIEKVQEVSDKLEKKYTEKKLDVKNRKLTINEIVELFLVDDFFFIPHAGNTKSIVKGCQDSINDAQRMILLMQSALEKVKEEAESIYNKGFDLLLNEQFRARKDIAYINFSDNHNIDSYPCIHRGDPALQNHEFYYVKGQKNYETLRLAFIDPESRIKSSKQYLELNSTNNIIEKIQIQKDNTFKGNELTFSPHLNVIIGGRSSGKSLLMNLFSRKIDKLKFDDKYKTILDSSSVQIKSKSDDNYKNLTSISTDIIFLNQGDIVRYFEENNLKDLAEKSNKATEYGQAIESFKKHKDEIVAILDSLKECYLESYNIGENKQYILHKQTIDRISSKEFIFKFSSEALTDRFGSLARDLNESQRVIDNLETEVKQLEKKELFSFADEEKSIISKFKGLLSSKKSFLIAKKSNNEKLLSFTNSISEKVRKINHSISENSQLKTEAQDTLNHLKKEIQKNLLKMRTLSLVCSKVEEFECSLKEPVKLDEFTDLVLEVKTAEGLKDIILEGISSSQNKKSLYFNLNELLKGKIKIKNYQDNKPSSFERKMSSIISDLYKLLDKPKDYLQYKDGSNSKNNSPGYNSEKYLEIILENPNLSLVFIDQPEDNLGNKFIAEILVNIIRRIKCCKQIFLVTHNPSIVVYGDAEAIIIARNDKNSISYEQIVLENETAQKEVCSILDGGEYIFNNRSRKYNIQRLLKEKDQQNGEN